APGTYAVEASWGPFYNQSTNAHYAIYDGGSLVQVVTADQTKTPSGASAGGVPFQILTHVTITSGTLTVVLSNSGNNTYVIADELLGPAVAGEGNGAADAHIKFLTNEQAQSRAAAGHGGGGTDADLLAVGREEIAGGVFAVDRRPFIELQRADEQQVWRDAPELAVQAEVAMEDVAFRVIIAADRDPIGELPLQGGQWRQIQGEQYGRLQRHVPGAKSLAEVTGWTIGYEL